MTSDRHPSSTEPGTSSLLYAGRPNWGLLDTIDPAEIR